MPPVGLNSSSLSGRVFLLALAACLMPLGTAFAQSLSNPPRVHVMSAADVTVTRNGGGPVVMRAAEGVFLDVLYVNGDRYEHRESNWYLVSLPPDAFGRRHMGWISGRAVEEAPPLPREEPMPEPTFELPAPVAPSTEPQTPIADDCPPVPVMPEMAPEMVEVVLHFDFDKSALTAEARTTLDAAVVSAQASGQVVSFQLEGHADWTGPESYNEGLGLRRAEAVKAYLVETHQIPATSINVMSFGESMPAASNDTRDGRAENRRVVVQIGG